MLNPTHQTRCDAALCLIHAGGALAFALDGQPAHAIVAAGAALVYGMLTRAGFTASAPNRRPDDAEAGNGVACEAPPDPRSTCSPNG